MSLPSSVNVGRQFVGEAGLNRVLGDLSGHTIERIRLVRTPIFDNWAFRKIRDVATRGGNKNPSHHDKTYHLYQELMLRDPVTGKRELIAFEKNERINIKRGLSAGSLQSASGGKIGPDDVKEVDLGNLKGALTFGDYIEGGKTQYRGNDYHTYSLRSNNCQRFTYSHLKAFGLGGEDVANFVVQKEVAALHPVATSITDAITNIAGKVVDRIY